MTLSLFSLNMGHVSVSHTCIGLYTQVNKALKGGNILYIKYSLTASNSGANHRTGKWSFANPLLAWYRRALPDEALFWPDEVLITTTNQDWTFWVQRSTWCFFSYSQRDGITRKNCCSFGLCPIYLCRLRLSLQLRKDLRTIWCQTRRQICLLILY